MHEVYQRRHRNGTSATVALDALGLGFEASICRVGEPGMRLGSWWRLEDAQRAADAAAHGHGCGEGCLGWHPAAMPITLHVAAVAAHPRPGTRRIGLAAR